MAFVASVLSPLWAWVRYRGVVPDYNGGVNNAHTTFRATLK
jgi:hypothetical protein